MSNDKVRGFEKVSRIKEDIQLPRRNDEGSAGYDFFAIEEIKLEHNIPTIIKTGVKAYMLKDEVLILCNRSSNPIKKHLVLINGIGVIDQSFYNNVDNDGEIGFIFVNTSINPVTINVGDKIGQGIFIKYFIVDNDNPVNSTRIGGFGSTGA